MQFISMMLCLDSSRDILSTWDASKALLYHINMQLWELTTINTEQGNHLKKKKRPPCAPVLVKMAIISLLFF